MSSSESGLVPYVDLIIQLGHRNRCARRNPSPSPVIETLDISPHMIQMDDGFGKNLSSKVCNFYSQVTINTEPMFQLIQMALERKASPTASEYIFDVRSS